MYFALCKTSAIYVSVALTKLPVYDEFILISVKERVTGINY